MSIRKIYVKIIRGWLIGILLFIPFQLPLAMAIKPWNNKLSAFINYLDEITITIFILLALVEFVKNRTIFSRVNIFFFLPIFLLGASGLISGIVNGNSLFITSLGTFDYIKNFLLIFIYSAFFNDFKKMFRLILTLAIIIGTVAAIQEVWALVSVYIIGKDVLDSSIYIFRKIEPLKYLQEFVMNYDAFWRIGLYKTPSLMSHPNNMGLYCLFVLSIYLCSVKKINPMIFIPLFFGIFASVSRMVYANFIIIMIPQIFRGRKLFITLSIFFGMLLVLMLFYKSNPIIQNIKSAQIQYDRHISGTIFDDDFRGNTRKKAFEIWKDHLLFGVGPGMYGGVISIKYNSYVFEKYNAHPTPFMKQINGIDQFYPQLLAEMGIIGAAAFVFLIIALFSIPFLLIKKETAFQEIRSVFMGLSLFIVCLLIYWLGSGLNISAGLFSYCAFIGIGVGVLKTMEI